MKRSYKILLVMLSIFWLVGCDQGTKNIARSELKNSQAVSYLGGTVNFIYAENNAGMLGLGNQLSDSLKFFLFRIFTSVALIFLFVYILNSRTWGRVKTIAFVLILCGGISNLIDRFFNDGHVIDFIVLGIGNLQTGIFNIADAYITFGALMLILTSLIEKKRTPEVNL